MGSSSRELRMGSAGTKVLSILMALVLAIGLMPMPKQAYAIESTPLATGDASELTLVVNGIDYDSDKIYVGANDDGWGGALSFADGKATAKEGSTYYVVLNNVSDYDVSYSLATGDIDTNPGQWDDWSAKFSMPASSATLTLNFAKQQSTVETHAVSATGTWDSTFAEYSTTGGTFTVKKRENSDGTGGLVAASSAQAGETIYVTPDAEDAYTVKSVKYSANGEDHDITSTLSFGMYSFAMPDADVTVTVTFESNSAASTLSLDVAINPNDAMLFPTTRTVGAGVELRPKLTVEKSDGALTSTDVAGISLKWQRKAPGESVFTDISGATATGQWNSVMDSFSDTNSSYSYYAKEATASTTPYEYQCVATWTLDGYETTTATSPTYKVTFEQAAPASKCNIEITESEGGSITASPTEFEVGDDITLTIVPASSNYEISWVRVEDEGGSGLYFDAEDIDNNSITFTASDSYDAFYDLDPDYNPTLTVTYEFKDISAAKYAVTADSSLVGGSISFGDYATEVAAGEGTSFIVTADLGYTIGEVTAYQTGNPTETVNVGFSGNGIYTIMSMPSHDVTVSATFVKGKIDLGDSRLTVKRFDGESYVYTGAAQDAMTPSFKNIPAGFTAPVLNQDYTISITQDGKEVVLKEFGTYTITLKATETSAEYTGTRTGTIYVTPYFTVYVQNGANAAPVEAKQYTEAQFKELVPDTSDYVSALYWKDDVWNVATAKTYVTLADLLDDAGLSGKWVSGSSIKYGTSNEFTYDEIAERSKFYPHAEATSSANKGDVRNAPFVFALEENSAAISGSNDAGTTETTNVAGANTKNAVRTIFGISESQYEAKSAAGSRLWSNLTSITIVTEDSTDEEKIDLGGSDIKKVKYFSGEKYGETGEVITPLVPEFTFASALPEGWANPVLGEDYTLSFEQDGKEVDLKERGTYTIKMTATDKSAHYKGTRTGTVEVTAYFTVYVQEGSDGAAEVKKEFSKGDFTSLKSDSTQPVSALFYKNNIWRVATAATYVTLDEVLSAAGVSGEWVSGAALKYDGGTFSYDVLAECSNFYPHAAGANSDDKSDVRKAPFVFALTGASSDTSTSVDAAAAEAANVAAANDSAAPRSIFGISEKQYADRNAMGSRLWDKLTSVTIITAEAPAKQANPIKVTGKSVEKTYSTSKQTIALKDALTVTGNQGAVTYEKVADKTSITVAANGVITLPAKLAAGKYTVKVKATAAGNDSYESGTAEATVTVTVKPVTVKAPTAVTGLTYSGKAQTGVKGGTGYTVTNGSKTDAGSYTATVKLSDAKNYTWTDGKTDAKSINFTIARAKVAAPTAKSGLKYNGKSQVAVKAATGYTVKNGSATNAGSHKATATLDKNHAWKDGSTSAKTISYKIDKIANTLSASAKAASVKLANVKKKAQTVTALTVKGAQGKVTYKKASGDKKLTVASNGKVTVAKGTKKGTYKASVKVTAAGNGNYNSATKTVTVKVTVK